LLEVKLYKSKWKAIKLLLLACPFIAASVYDLWYNTTMMPDWLSWLSLCFFGLAIPMGLFTFFDRRPQIIINETGIFDRLAYKDFINWNIIDDAYIVSVHGQHFICLIIKDEFKHLIPNKGKLKNLSLAMGFQELNINLGQVNIRDINKFGLFIIAMSKADNSTRNRLLKNGIN